MKAMNPRADHDKADYQPNILRRSKRAHSAVLKALGELLLEKPLTSISIEAIAERAGVSKKTIYRWYPDKASLFMDLYHKESPTADNIPDVGSLEIELNRASLQIWRFWKETASGQAFRQLLASCQQNAQSMDKLRDLYMPSRRKITKDVIDRGIARGEIKKKNYDFLIDMLIGFNWYHLITNSLDDESVIPRMTSVLIRGIKPDLPRKRVPKS
jgi:AcrR family transcriptional regulator